MEFEKHCWAEVDLDALAHNFKLIAAHAAPAKVCAVVKAGAYGHADGMVCQTLQAAGAEWFAVSCLAEALHLRSGGVTGHILILGHTDPAYAAQLISNDLTQAVFSGAYAQALSENARAAGGRVKAHLKVDTGMGRLGFGVRGDFDRALAQLKACYGLPGLSITGVFQHFAAADSDDAGDIAFTEAQQALFERTLQALRQAGCPTGVVHSANSAAQLRHPEWRGSMTRAGIVLYGLDPSPEARFPALRPVMTLKTVVTHLNRLHPGESVSYGRTYTADRERLTATVAVGYADGYPRRLSGSDAGGVMLVRGCPAPVLGRVCMDQTVLDVTDVPGVAMGDEVTVFGPAGAAAGADTADTIAQKTGTINYEVVCGISRRVPRIYLQGGALVEIWNDLEEG